MFNPDQGHTAADSLWILFMAGVIAIVTLRHGIGVWHPVRDHGRALQVGDQVRTTLGVTGRVVQISDQVVSIQLMNHRHGRTSLVVHESTILEIIPPDADP